MVKYETIDWKQWFDPELEAFPMVTDWVGQAVEQVVKYLHRDYPGRPVQRKHFPFLFDLKEMQDQLGLPAEMIFAYHRCCSVGWLVMMNGAKHSPAELTRKIKEWYSTYVTAILSIGEKHEEGFVQRDPNQPHYMCEWRDGKWQVPF